METSERECARLILEVLPLSMRFLWKKSLREITPDSSMPQFRVLMRLHLGPCSLQALAREHSVSAPTASRLVSTLVERGLVDRRPDPADRRLVLLSLTEKGKAHLKAWHEQALSLVSEWVAFLNRDEKDALVRGLSALAHAFPAMPEQRENWRNR